MKLPPALFGATLLFWGWQTGYLLFAIPMAIVLEAARFSSFRLKLMPKDFYRMMDLSALILVGMVIVRYGVSTESMARWLPMAVFPVLLAQAFSTVQGVDLGAIFLVVRRQEKRHPQRPRRTIDLSYHGFVITLIATSAANLRTPTFYVGLVFLVLWALWPFRPKRYPVIIWAMLFAAAAGLGWYGQLGLRHLQKVVEGATISFLMQGSGETDPFQVTTSIGDIGRLKLKDRIVMRVIPESHFEPNQLFRTGIYSHYRAGRWFAIKSNFTPLSESDDGSWELGPSNIPAHRASVFRKFPRGEGLLPVPTGVSKIENLAGLELSANRLGAIYFKGASNSLYFQIVWDGQTSRGDAPDAGDLKIPRELKPLTMSIVKELGIQDLPPELILTTVEAFFEDFEYSLVQPQLDANTPPLETFLKITKSGHCEHFASATALLLRATGIPTRYAVGYLVTEFSQLGNCFNVRQRHAHAWTLAYIGNAWRPIDNTPSLWVAQETPDASIVRWLMEMTSYLKYRFDRWRHTIGISDVMTWGMLVVVICIPFLLIRLRRLRGMVRKRKKAVPSTDNQIYSREAFPFDRLERHIRDAFDIGRYSWEPYGKWFNRLEKAGVVPNAIKQLEPLLMLHYRHCFSSTGLTIDEERELNKRVDAWIANLSS